MTSPDAGFLNMLKVSFFLAYRSIKRTNIGTTILTVSIISFVLVNLIFLPSVVNGLQESIEEESRDNLYGNILIEPKENNIYINGVSNIQKNINRLSGVIGTAPRYATGATFSHEDNFLGGTLYSMVPSDEVLVSKIHKGIISGEYLSDSDMGEILLGRDLAGEKDVEEEQPSLKGAEVGDTITVTFSNGIIKDYRVKGIFGVSKMGTDSLAFISEKEMESVLGIDDKASLILVKLSNIGSEDEFCKKFIGLGISEDMKTWQEKISGVIGSITGTFNLLTMITTVVSLIIAVVIILVIVYINTVHNRRQIGILKAIGIGQNVIIFSYVFQALFYCIAGIFFGSFLLWILAYLFTQNPIAFPMGEVSPIITFSLIAKSSISLLIISIIGGFLPSWQTARQSILKSIWG